MHLRLVLSTAAATGVAALFPAAASAQRVLGLDVSAWQGDISQTTWNNISNIENRKFVFIRASRGGTTGEYHAGGGYPSGDNTEARLSQRYDDPYYIQNVNRATAAGMFVGSYHFGRHDIMANTVGTDGIPAGVDNSGTDEANHYIQMAGPFMRPGYLPPTFDLEGPITRTDEQLTQFTLDFSNRIYAVMGIRPAIYINGNFAQNVLAGASAPLRNELAQPSPNPPSQVSSAYSQIWSARWPNQANPDAIDVQNAHPKDSFSAIYGPWDDYGTTHPWAFWQYASTGRLQSFNNGGSNLDFDVAQGDVEFVKDQLIPALWMNNVSGDWSTLSNWNSGQTPIAPPAAEGQLTPLATGPLPTPRLPGAAGTGTGPTSAQNDTVILERPTANITVTLSTGTHNIRKLFMRETLNITGGSLTVNYDPLYYLVTDPTNQYPNALHSGPISAQFSGNVTLSGTGALSVHTLQVDATRTFALNAGTLTLDRVNLMPHSTTPANITLGGDVTINPLNNAAAVIANGVGTGSTGIVNLGGGIRTITVGNGSAATDLTIAVPVTNGSLTKAGAGTLALTAANTYTGNTTMAGGVLSVGAANHVGSAANTLVFNGGTLRTSAGVAFARNVTVNAAGGTFDGGAFNSSVNNVAGAGSLNKVGTGTLTATQVKIGGLLTVNGGSIVIPANGTPGRTLEASVVGVAGGAKLNMNDNDMIVNYSGASPEFNLRNKALLARDGGVEGIFFTGSNDINSDKILAFGEASELAINSYNGVTIDGTTVVGKYTYYGDANFDGKVTSDDYVAVDLGLGTGNSWVQGDFDFNGLVTTDDYVVVDLNLGKGTTTPLAYAEEQAEMIALHSEMFGQSYRDKLAYASEFGWVAASVPEPGTLGIAAFATALTGITRRHRLVKAAK